MLRNKWYLVCPSKELTSKMITQKILGEDKTVGFTIAAAHKDNDVFQRVVQSFELESPILITCGERQQTAIDAGLGEDDPAALVSFAYQQG